jgi:carbamoyl-phosphate synthase large subunit
LSYKIHEPQRPNILDEIKSKEIHLIINTPVGKASAFDDAYIRKAAIKYKIPYATTTAAARASAQGIAEHRRGRAGVKSLQSYHADIR